jgi:tRNA acetyltransferase TAN1
VGKPGTSVLIHIQTVEKAGDSADEADPNSDEDDIESQIQKEIEGLNPSTKKSSLFQAVKFDLPCCP